jgi:hypothetical protein
MTVEHLPYLTQVIEIWNPEYPVHAFLASPLIMYCILYSPVKAKSALKGAEGGGSMNKERLNFLSP